ncbi:MAG TPA: peptidoglycan recognition family protein [Stackebrandtia sp.]|uniref:peptidoglycan recognition protein family protein n=1 Tax=Stackebrandtia sp. TaxID=2023065 RepID=UPI002D22ED0E|nr:peptidoglycan recognition family protein [Stackebrandtia sp.]HZE37438.1 peptidoglycan recognition family protein [Stackebrandtia sp.]
MSTSPSPSRRNVLRGAILIGAGGVVGGGALLASGIASAEVTDPKIIGCDAWGARQPADPLNQLDNNPDKILIHHTASSNDTGTTEDDAKSIAQQIQHWHMDENGWSDTGQHFTVSRGGFALEGRHTSLQHLTDGKGMVQGAHCPGQNTSAIGIEHEGLYTSIEPPKALYDKTVELCAFICGKYSIDPKEIYGHRDYYSTECPGEKFYAMLPQLRKDVAAKMKG